MEYRFFVLVRGPDPTIYKVPVCQTARLINEFPDQKFQIYEALQDAKKAMLRIASRATANVNEDLRTTTLKLTEDRVERFQL